ncbi:MAG: hypothetical protein IPK99_06855 [Flavobacteriales bacterium]|nr:hypothetical protein [Flavobacteriales bacterium]
MMRALLLLTALVCAFTLSAQTYFYIDEIGVDPQPATPADNISIDLIGGLSSTGAYVVSASAQVTGNVVTISIVAADPGGFTVIVPHVETVPVGQLPAGTYTIDFNAQFVGDFAPQPQHTFVVSGVGAPCDSLEVISVQWHAFTDTAIVVHVHNANTDSIYSYPNFILLDDQGDTIAVEETSSFALVQESWHLLRVKDGVTPPLGNFNGTLELWTGFTTYLSCSWSMSFNLCPPPPCPVFIPTIQNLGGAIPIGTYDWIVFDTNGTTLANGVFELGIGQEFDADTLCLPPGSYFMDVSPNDPPTGGAPYFGVSVGGYIAGPSQPVVWSLPVAMPFDFYLPCADGPNSVPETGSQGLLVQQYMDRLVVRRVDGGALGTVELFDAQGKLLELVSAATNEIALGTTHLPQGLLLLRTTHGVARVVLVGN